jgi:hypothetical protein
MNDGGKGPKIVVKRDSGWEGRGTAEGGDDGVEGPKMVGMKGEMDCR